MSTAQGSIESTVVELSEEAWNAFADDISTMFDVEIECEQTDVGLRTLADIQKRYRKVSTFHSVHCEGVLSGTFVVGFDCGGLFTLGGVIVMLPTDRVKESAKQPTLSEAEAMRDAVSEVGNLLVGAWDRVFRQELEGHKHFRKGNTFVGNPWEKTESVFGLSLAEEFHYIEYRMTVGDFTPFTCGVIFPLATLLGEESESQPDEAPAPDPEPSPPAAEEPVQTPEPITEPAAAELPDEQATQETDPKPTEAPEVPDIAPAPQAQTQANIQPEEVDEHTVAPRDIPRPPSASTPARVIASNEGLADILSLPVREVMDTRVVWGRPSESVQDLLSTMQQHDVGYAMIGEEGVLDGIVSKSNILGAISPYLRPVFAKWHTPADDATLNIKIQWVMTRPVRTVGPHATLGIAIESMQHFGGRCLPVVGDRGEVQGILTVFDIFRIFSRNDQFGTSGRTPQAPCLMI